MDHRINRSFELRREEHAQLTAWINAEGWRQVRALTWRDGIARALLALAARIAPTVTRPTPLPGLTLESVSPGAT
jgi:hypothetical protein